MLLKDDGALVSLRIFDLYTLEELGEVNVFESFIWPNSFNAYSSFELWAPVNDENRELLKDGNIIWPDGSDTAGIIEIINPEKNDKGTKRFNIKGRTLESLLTRRIIWGTYNKSSRDYPSTIMMELVNQSAINPSDEKRKIPFLELDKDPLVGEKITYQKTGGELYESVNKIATDANIGFRIVFDAKNKKMIFQVLSGVDRTYDNEGDNEPVILDSDLQDILTSNYYRNSQDYKNIALVAGEDSGEARKKVTVGDDESYGFDRREVYIDARDLQSEVASENENGSKDESGVTEETSSLTEEEYNELLIQRGNEKMSEMKITETFEASLRVTGSQYEFGKDYFIGDTITAVDRELGIIVDAQISAAQEEFNGRYNLAITVGYEYPTLYKKIKRDLM